MSNKKKTLTPWPISSSVTLHQFTKNFVDIEAPVNDVWVGCFNEDSQRNVAFISMYLLDEKNAWFFFYRRPLGIRQCRLEEQKYRKLMEGAKTIRIVGIHGLETEDGPDSNNPRIPERFTNVKKIRAATFVRLQAKGKCKAYFEDDCELPKNYWSGTIPNNH